MTKILFILMLLFPSIVLSDDYLRKIDAFELQTTQNISYSFQQQPSTYLVLYIQGNGCPIARLSYPAFHEIQQEFHEDTRFEFLGVNANIQDTPDAINREIDEFKIQFPILKDSRQQLAKQLGVERTAEVFVIERATGQVLFRGPINDQLGYETQRMHTTQHYLRDALQTILDGGRVDHDLIPESKGCLVGIFF